MGKHKRRKKVGKKKTVTYGKEIKIKSKIKFQVTGERGRCKSFYNGKLSPPAGKIDQ